MIKNKKTLFSMCVLAISIISCSNEDSTATINSVTGVQHLESATSCEGEVVSEEKYLSQFPNYQKGQTWIYNIKFDALKDDNQSAKREFKFLLGVLDVKDIDNEIETVHTENESIVQAGVVQDSDYLKHRFSNDTSFSNYKPKTQDTIYSDADYFEPVKSFGSLFPIGSFNYNDDINRTIYRVGETTVKFDGQDYPTQHYCIKSELKKPSILPNSSLFETQKHVWLSPQVGIIHQKLDKRIEFLDSDYSSEITLKTFKPGTGKSYGVSSAGGLYEVFPEMVEVENVESQFNRSDEQELNACTSGTPSEISQILKTYPEPIAGQIRRYAFIGYSHSPYYPGGMPSPGVITYTLSKGAETDFNLSTKKIIKNYPNVPASKDEDSREFNKETLNKVIFDPNYSLIRGLPEKVFSLGTEKVTVNGKIYDTQKYCLQSTEDLRVFKQSRVYVGWFQPGTGLIKSVAKLSEISGGPEGVMTQYSQIQP